MLSKLVTPAKGLLTLFTLVGLLARVDFLMLSQLVATAEGFPALLALIGILPARRSLRWPDQGLLPGGRFRTAGFPSVEIPPWRAPRPY